MTNICDINKTQIIIDATDHITLCANCAQSNKHTCTLYVHTHWYS